MPDAPEKLIRLIDKLEEAAIDADSEIDDAFGILYGIDAEGKWDGYIIGSDSPLVVAAANVRLLRDELSRLANDLRTLGEPF